MCSILSTPLTSLRQLAALLLRLGEVEASSQVRAKFPVPPLATAPTASPRRRASVLGGSYGPPALGVLDGNYGPSALGVLGGSYGPPALGVGTAASSRRRRASALGDLDMGAVAAALGLHQQHLSSLGGSGTHAVEDSQETTAGLWPNMAASRGSPPLLGTSPLGSPRDPVTPAAGARPPSPLTRGMRRTPVKHNSCIDTFEASLGYGPMEAPPRGKTWGDLHGKTDALPSSS